MCYFCRMSGGTLRQKTKAWVATVGTPARRTDMEPENADGWKRHEEEIRETFTNNPFFRGSSCSFWGFQPSQISMFLWASLAHQKIHANWLWHLSSPLVPSGWPIHSCESGSYIQSVEDQVPFAAGRNYQHMQENSRSGNQAAHQKHNPSQWDHMGICFNFVYSHITYEYDKEICTTMYYIAISI